MGSPLEESGREAQERQHLVTLSLPFYLATTEITQVQWEVVMGTNPSRFGECPDCPVEEISADEIESFLTRASELEGVNFRLPTEAEWEYACRAGTESVFGIGDELGTDQANYDGHYPMAGQASGEFRQRTTPVGSFAANPWGLFDMNGNVWEWTADLHCEYSAGHVTSAVVGGQENEASGTGSTMSGGQYCEASGGFSSVSGGNSNEASGPHSSVAGGDGNSASGCRSAICGGLFNFATNQTSVVSGGERNRSRGFSSSISGGSNNIVDGAEASISGGRQNTAPGKWATVSGGLSRTAPGDDDWVAGSLFEEN